MATTVHSVTIPGHGSRRIAKYLLDLDRPPLSVPRPLECTNDAIRIVCIADTHDRHPVMPDGDLLIHAGDLTDNGGFDAMQQGLKWLSSQPHQYKIYVAGNHDVLLDEAFLTKHHERRYGDERTLADLDWGDLIYLKDSSVTLKFTNRQVTNSNPLAATKPTAGDHQLTVYGSPWTPQYLTSAFQYARGTDFWCDRLPKHIDVFVCHGPPRLYGDKAGAQNAGCPSLTKEIARIRPRLVVFGHIHAGYGRQDTVLDKTKNCYDDIHNDFGNSLTLFWMICCILYNKIMACLIFMLGLPKREKITTFVNAAIVGGACNDVKNPPIVVQLDT